jgi:streptogramin lyase
MGGSMCRAHGRRGLTRGWWIAVLLCAACTTSTPTAAITPSAESGPATVQLAGFPSTAASDSSGLWVANSTAGSIVRVNGATHLRQISIPIGKPTALEPSCAPENESDPIGAWLQRRCDLPSGVALGAGSVWVGRNDRRAVMRLDPATGHTIASVSLGFRVFNIAASPSAVWVVSFEDNMIARIDPKTNAVTLRHELLHAPSGVLLADGSVWISTSGNATVVRLDADTGTPQAAIAVGGQPLPLAAGAGAIWVRCEQDSTIDRIDPSTNKVVATVPVYVFFGRDGLDNMVADQAGVWTTGLHLQRIDAAANRVSRTLPLEGRPYDAGGGSLWVVSLEGRITRISPGA